MAEAGTEKSQSANLNLGTNRGSFNLDSGGYLGLFQNKSIASAGCLWHGARKQISSLHRVYGGVVRVIYGKRGLKFNRAEAGCQEQYKRQAQHPPRLVKHRSTVSCEVTRKVRDEEWAFLLTALFRPWWGEERREQNNTVHGRLWLLHTSQGKPSSQWLLSVFLSQKCSQRMHAFPCLDFHTVLSAGTVRLKGLQEGTAPFSF